jgi:hypothetical protein
MKYNNQCGGGSCSICGAPNTNKTSCPKNPNNVNKDKSKLHKLGSKKLSRGKSQNKSVSPRKISGRIKRGTTTKSFIKKEELTSRKREYLTHYNGGRPFKVVATNRGIEVYSNTEKKLLLLIKRFKGYWAGVDPKDAKMRGNSILVQKTKKSYISIGREILSFETEEEINDYVSPVGNADVPYPVAYTANYVYFMLDMEYVRRDKLTTEATPDNAEDIYSEYYGHLYPENQKKMDKRHAKLF